MTLVYRVETIHGTGPYDGLGYSSIHTLCDDDADGFDFVRHPSPNETFSDDSWQVYSFAFPSVRELVRWFNFEERRTLRESGYVVSLYDASFVVMSSDDRQCVFDKESAKLVAQLWNTEHKTCL